MEAPSEVQASSAVEGVAAGTITSYSLPEAQSSNNDTSLPPVNNSLITMHSQLDDNPPSPLIKQEPSGLQTPHHSSSQLEMDNTNRAVSTLKNEHGLRTQSPLRESSIPVPSTEMSANEQTIPAKRPAPAKTKKGTAKKAPPAKRRKLVQNRSATPSSRPLKPGNIKNGSNIGTPVNSSPTRSVRSTTGDSDEEDEDEDMSGGEVDDDNLYCICKKPDNGTFMIGCDGPCEDWFHGKCVNVQEKYKNLIDKFICPNCEAAGEGQTTYKRMCRRHGCRQPARTGKSKSGKEASKYCSDDCGVQFFRDLAAKSRGQEEIAKNRRERRRGGTDAPVEDDSEARGGVLSAGEIKALLATSKSAADFQRLGEGVLSPPDTPDEKGNTAEIKFTDTEASSIEQIHYQKEAARRRHQIQKDRLKFITMIKQSASRVTAEKELKPRDYCGYDARLEWTPEQFAAWRDSAAGKRAFELETLAVESNASVENENMPESAEGETDAEQDVCDRKKCLRHLDWAKMIVDGLRAEMTENSDHMRALEQEEKSLRERAALRAKSGQDPSTAGTVEFHDDISPEDDAFNKQSDLNLLSEPQFTEMAERKPLDEKSTEMPDALIQAPHKELLTTAEVSELSGPAGDDIVVAENAELEAADEMDVIA